MKPLGLYIHIPFCKSKCGYCDFNSYPHMEDLLDAYCESLKQEFQRRRKKFMEPPLDSIYFGGGTPTILDGEKLSDLVRFFITEANISLHREVTVEANPGTLAIQKLKALKAAGVNRLSIGVQSFKDAFLRKLGRGHFQKEAFDAIHHAREAGFRNLSLDLIFGLPGQTLADWREELRMAFKFSPEHISAYQLTVERGTEFERTWESGQLHLPPESTVTEMHQRTPPWMAGAGYERYEISNYAKGGMVCSHNVNTWSHGEYMGIGAGACSFLGGTRIRNAENIMDYMDRVKRNLPLHIEEEKIDGEKEIAEIIMLGLRTSRGVDLKVLKDRLSSKKVEGFLEIISVLERDSLLHVEGERMRLTGRGMLFSNEVFLKFMA